ncbi:hypothetical protein DFJ73DRAFT_924788 [Zopfochytrium polystomum]|nr:hypothetical protein DFJ73DRAFT_924788 [Zopfochytrium polystomum]
MPRPLLLLLLLPTSSSSSSSSSFTIRAARPDDAAALGAMAARTFVATFGHLYSSADLDAFSRATYSAERMRADLLDPDFSTFLAVPHPTPAGTAAASSCRSALARSAGAAGPPDTDADDDGDRKRRQQQPPTTTPPVTSSRSSDSTSTPRTTAPAPGRALMDVLMETALALPSSSFQRRRRRKSCRRRRRRRRRPNGLAHGVDGQRAGAAAVFYEKYRFCEAGACEFVVPGIKDSLVYVLRREG